MVTYLQLEGQTKEGFSGIEPLRVQIDFLALLASNKSSVSHIRGTGKVVKNSI